MSTSHNNPEKSPTTKLNKYTALDFSFFQCSIDPKKISLIIIEVKIESKTFLKT